MEPALRSGGPNRLELPRSQDHPHSQPPPEDNGELGGYGALPLCPRLQEHEPGWARCRWMDLIWSADSHSRAPGGSPRSPSSPLISPPPLMPLGWVTRSWRSGSILLVWSATVGAIDACRRHTDRPVACLAGARVTQTQTVDSRARVSTGEAARTPPEQVHRNDAIPGRSAGLDYLEP